MTCHEVGARGTNLCAIEKERDMGRRRVLRALVETVPYAIQAGLVTSGTGIDARLH